MRFFGLVGGEGGWLNRNGECEWSGGLKFDLVC